MAEIDWDDMSEDEQIEQERRDNKRIRRNSRELRTAMLDKITKDKDSDKFPNLDGSNKQVYAIVAVLDGQDRDVQESEKALAQRDGPGNTGAFVTAVFEEIVNRIGDPSSKFSSGERGSRTVGDGTRLRPENTATAQHMHSGNDAIEFNDVFIKKDE